MQIAVISDIHAAERCTHPRRRGEFGDILLLRTVHRLNRFIRPDVVLVLGDLIDDPQAADASERLQALKAILDRLQCPKIVIPGNHDPHPDRFYEIMERPADTVDIGGVRFLPFVDAEEPGYNARRSESDLARLRAARSGHIGPVVALQHVPVLPPGQTNCPYTYTNIGDVLEAGRTGGVDLWVGGHAHAGTALIHTADGSSYLGVKALCEEPYTFTLLTLDEAGVRMSPQALMMPRNLQLVDYHSHTEFAYCSENMHTTISPQLAELFGLAGMAFTEHSGQLYFERKAYSSGDFCQTGIAGATQAADRTKDYWLAASKVTGPTVVAGLEVDSDFQGRPVLQPHDRERARVLNGAMHNLSSLRQRPADPERVADEFLYVLERFAKTGIQILAHPFRIFRRARMEVPTHLFRPTVDILKAHNVAAEINFHTNEPEPAFFRLCIDAGVKLTFGSDAHNLYEVGEFYPHLEFLRTCGYDGDLGDILADPAGLRDATNAGSRVS